MATTASLLSRLRLELADSRVPFQSNVLGDGFTTRYELPHSPVEPADFDAFTVNAGIATPLLAGTDYTLDGSAGVIELTSALPAGVTLYSRGTGGRFFSDAELTIFLDTAFTQHTHGTGQSLATLPKVEDYLVVLLAVIEALYVTLNDATFDIDVNTPEGVSIPRTQRFRQIMQVIEERKQQYEELAQALNVGLKRIEMFTLRRVSRTTGRYVPIYIDREIEDASAPRRIYPPISLQGAKQIDDPITTQDIVIEQGIPVVLPIELGMDITGKTVRAQVRRSHLSAPLLYFDVEVRDAVAGSVTITLRDTSRHRIWFDGDMAWDIRVIDPPDLTGQFRNVSRTMVKGKVYVIERPRI